MTWREQLLNAYERQLAQDQAHPALVIAFGPNDPATYPDNCGFLLCSYTLPILPMSAAEPGSNGRMLEYALPGALEPTMEVRVLDYDLALEERLRTFTEARTQLRFMAWGQWLGVGRIAKVPISRPWSHELVLTLALTGVRVFKSSVGSCETPVKDFDGVSSIHILNIPFAITAPDETTFKTYSWLHGTELLP